MPSTRGVPGTFSWLVLSTSDGAAAARFYSKLFGWMLIETPAGAILVTPAGQQVATLLERQSHSFARRNIANWLPFVKVRSTDTEVERVTRAGGDVAVQPSDVGGLRIAVIRGATGEALGIYDAPEGSGVELVTDPRTAVWFELATREPERASAYYRELFGWRISDEAGYTFIGNESGQFGGLVRLEGDWEDHAFLAAIGRAKGDKLDVPPHWMVFFGVDDCEAAVDQAEDLGALVSTRVEPLHTVGNFAVLRDPQGVYFSILSKR